MELNIRITYFIVGCIVSFAIIRYIRFGFYIMLTGIIGASIMLYHIMVLPSFLKAMLYDILPFFFCNLLLFVFVAKDNSTNSNKLYRVILKTKGSKYILDNIRRGVSIIGAAGSGKTESVVYSLLEHFSKHKFCGVIHDYKHFEISEMAFPLFKKSSVDFYMVSFDPICHKVNPIAPRYLPDEESVYEISRVLLENLLELKESDNNSSSRFFKDAVEGLIGGLIWRLRTNYQDYCTIPHLIALYQYLDTKALVKFLRADLTAKAMADAFISGVGSDRQTAGVKSTLANAFKKISTKKIFMVLSEDGIPLDINNPEHPAIISIVNNPKKEASLSPVIATIMHTITKQMSEQGQKPSFILLEEASTIRLLNMHRIPATLRSYDIVTVYVLQDKIQNDMMYGDKASKAILSNLSYQFFGKANDPDTAKYYERFFEIVKKPTKSISKSSGLSWESRITKGEKEVAKTRADAFYGLKQGEFIVFADGEDKRLRFRQPQIKRELPSNKTITQEDLDANFIRIHKEVKSIFK